MTDEGQRVTGPLVVLPTYNERDNLAPIVREILTELPQATLWIVDDNSPDGTGKLADELASEDERIHVEHRPGKMGLGTAYIHAFTLALAGDYDCVIEMDADFSHDPRYLPQLLAALEDADLVIGSRYVDGGGTQNWSAARQWISRVGNMVARIGLGVKTRDATGGYRAYRRTTLEQLHFEDLQLRGYGFQVEIVFQVERRGLRVKEIPIIFVERASGTSKMSKAIVLEAILHILRRRFDMLRGVPEPEPDAVHLASQHIR
ncbi:MAG TPA: polyprenol monophosphomannose synthase [Chloroflexota bacterium]|nr:polyprenol monophosphomannose synthase [Chloroflexota bacterium]